MQSKSLSNIKSHSINFVGGQNHFVTAACQSATYNMPSSSWAMQPLAMARRDRALQHSSSGCNATHEPETANPQKGPRWQQVQATWVLMASTDATCGLHPAQTPAPSTTAPSWDSNTIPGLRDAGAAATKEMSQHSMALHWSWRVPDTKSASGTALWMKAQDMASKGCSFVPVKKQGNVWGCLPSLQRRRKGNYCKSQLEDAGCCNLWGMVG